MKDVKQFFKDNPRATSVLLAGDQLFLVGYESEAAAYANKAGVTVEVVNRDYKAEPKPDSDASK